MDYTVDNQKSLLEALAADDCDKIILSEDVELEDKLILSKNVDFDLSGYKLYVGATEGITATKGKVSFVNGIIVAPEDDPIVAENAGTVVTLGDNLKINATKCAVYVRNKAKVIIADADVESLGDHAAVFVEGSGTAKENTTLDMRDGQIIATQQIGVSVMKGGIFLLKGGRVESQVDEKNKDKTSAIYLNGARSRMDMTGGEVYSEFTSALSVIESASATITGGIISSKTTTETAVSLQGANSSFVMAGGKISGESSDGILVGGLDKDQTSAISIQGGVIAVPASKNVISEVAGGGKAAIAVTGGRFHGKLDVKYIPEGYAGELDDLGYVEVKKVEDIDPQPEPEPDPEPGPKPPTPDPIIVNKSGILDKPTPVYGSPSRRFIICHLVGSVKVITEGHVDNDSGLTFSYVQYVLAGFGGTCTGYVLSSDIRFN